MKKIITIMAAMFLLGNGLMAQEPAKTKVEKEKVKKEKFRLVVSFISKGQGIDGKTMEKIDAYIAAFSPKPGYENCQWGREGESDYCFHLKELKHHEQKKFIEGLEKLITDKEMVQVKQEHELDRKCRTLKTVN
jgi:hypothetical protein